MICKPTEARKPRTIDELRWGDFTTLLVDNEFREAARLIKTERQYDGTVIYHFIGWENGKAYDWYVWKDGDRFTYGGGAHTVTLA